MVYGMGSVKSAKNAVLKLQSTGKTKKNYHEKDNELNLIFISAVEENISNVTWCPTYYLFKVGSEEKFRFLTGIYIL